VAPHSARAADKGAPAHNKKTPQNGRRPEEKKERAPDLGLDVGVLVLGAIHLGNHNRVDLGEALGQLLVDGGQRLHSRQRSGGSPGSAGAAHAEQPQQCAALKEMGATSGTLHSAAQHSTAGAPGTEGTSRHSTGSLGRLAGLPWWGGQPFQPFPATP
jgi:hypothetical protein